MPKQTADPYLSIVDFETLQHYKNRAPIWIKLYANLWDNPRFEALADETKAHFVGLCVLASRHENRIPFEPEWIVRKLGANRTIDFDALFASNLLARSSKSASKTLAHLVKPASTEKEKRESREEEKREEPIQPPSASSAGPKYDDMFKGFWDLSTKRGSKVEAYREWQRLNPDVSLLEDILAAMHDWMQSAQWQDESKQPHLCRWLKRRGWEERVPRPPVIERKETRDEFIARTNRETAEIVNRGLSDPTFNGDWAEYQSRPSGPLRQSLSGPPDEPS